MNQLNPYELFSIKDSALWLDGRRCCDLPENMKDIEQAVEYWVVIWH